MLAAGDPLQREHRLRGRSSSVATSACGPAREFSATVRILRREDYSMGPLASLVPTDFAVGWGPMSDSAVLADIEISQGNRFYFWRTETWPIERARNRDATRRTGT